MSSRKETTGSGNISRRIVIAITLSCWSPTCSTTRAYIFELPCIYRNTVTALLKKMSVVLFKFQNLISTFNLFSFKSEKQLFAKTSTRFQKFRFLTALFDNKSYTFTFTGSQFTPTATRLFQDWALNNPPFLTFQLKTI